MILYPPHNYVGTRSYWNFVFSKALASYPHMAMVQQKHYVYSVDLVGHCHSESVICSAMQQQCIKTNIGKEIFSK